MSVVKMNVITVPEERRNEFEERFAKRAGMVSQMDGFEAFELLRPKGGDDRYIVYTRWDSEESFAAWLNSPAFQHGHKAHSEAGPVGTASELWAYEVVEAEYAG